MDRHTFSLPALLRVALLSFTAFHFAPTTSLADECTEYAYVPQTEKCLGYGMLMHLDIVRRRIDADFARAYLPSFYQIVVVRAGRNGISSDSYTTNKVPPGIEHEWFANFYVYVTPEYLIERNSYPSLVRVGAMSFCESHYIDYPVPTTDEKILARREETERCVYENMRLNEEHYLSALRREIELGDAYLRQFKDLPSTRLRETIRTRYGPARNSLN